MVNSGIATDSMKPVKAINEPAMVTIRQPNMFAKADAIGPEQRVETVQINNIDML